MKTIWGETLDPNAVLQEYPRPQMVRGSYRNLNGLWDYAITDAAAPPERWDGEILVPFSPEAPLSGVGRTLLPGQTLWYRRTLAEQPREGARLLLHFGAAVIRSSDSTYVELGVTKTVPTPAIFLAAAALLALSVPFVLALKRRMAAGEERV